LFAYGFRFYFTPLTAVLFTFPSRYLFTFGHVLVFSLAGWSPLLHAKFLVYRTTQDSRHCVTQNLQGYHLLWRCFPAALLPRYIKLYRSYNPKRRISRFGLFQFRSPLLSESRLLSFPRLTEMFHFRRSRYTLLKECLELYSKVIPFGYPQVITYIRLAVAFVECYVLRRLYMPRHPPYALKNYRVFCAVKNF
jgi:hypothetical protein